MRHLYRRENNMNKNKTTRKTKNSEDKLDSFVDNVLKAPKAIFNFLTGDSAQVILGLICIMFAFYMLLAFVSFFFTGDADQSVIEQITEKDMANLDGEFANHAGSIGARLAFFWINDCFGISAFLIPLFLLMLGFKLVRAYKINIWKWFISFSIIMFWFSIALAYFATPFFDESFIKPGGDHGIYVSKWIAGQIGVPGLIIGLITVALIFLIYLSNETINLIRDILNPTRWFAKIPLQVKVADGETNESEKLIIEEGDDNPMEKPEPEPETPAPTVDLSTKVEDNEEPKEPKRRSYRLFQLTLTSV